MKAKSNICCIFNIGPHYREPIYQAIANQFHCNFYLGDRVSTNIKKFNYENLPGYKKTLKRLNIFKEFYWQRGAVGTLFKPYKTYIITGEPFCLSTWVLLLLSKFMHKKCIAWTHGWYGRETGIKKFIKKTFFKLFSHILTYNEYTIPLLEKEGLKRENITCIANSLNSHKQLEIRKQLQKTDIFTKHFNNDNPVILYCGRIQKVKKLEMIIDSAKALIESEIPVNVVFVGKDDENVNLDNYSKELGIEDNIWMYGPSYDEKEIGEIFYNSAVCVSPGNVGLTAIHSLTFGCPVVTHDNFTMQMPEFEAIKEGITGSFFKENDNNDLTSKIKFWINRNAEEREQTRAEAFKEIDRKWNIDSQIETLKSVFEKLNYI